MYKLFGDFKNYVLINSNQLFLDKCPFLHPPTLCPAFFPIKINLFLPYFYGYKAIHWSMVSLPEATHLKKSDSSSPKS